MTEISTVPTLNTYQSVSGFDAADIAILASISALVGPRLPDVTDDFYQQMRSDPAAAAIIDGRIEELKLTHLAWLNALFSGATVDSLVALQQRTGWAHVKAKVPQLFVAASMSYLRSVFPELFASLITDRTEASKATKAILRTLDVCQFLIDNTYQQCLIENLGIKPELLTLLMTAN